MRYKRAPRETGFIFYLLSFLNHSACMGIGEDVGEKLLKLLATDTGGPSFMTGGSRRLE